MSVDLRVDWCDYKAAKYAVEHWHYSQVVPAGKIAKFGAWEDGRFIGVVLYSWGANNNIGKPYGLKQTEVCELVRVALTNHVAPVSQIVSVTLRMLKAQSPGVRLIVSYADPREGHNGGIYQAMNWVYTEQQNEGSSLYFHNGKFVHQRTASSAYGSITGLQRIKVLPKHRYLYRKGQVQSLLTALIWDNLG